MSATAPLPEPAEGTPEAATPAARTNPGPRAPVALGIGILAAIAVVAALYLARAFFVPLLIGILASYALRPFVDWLKACGIPRAAGAALVLAALVAGTTWAAFSLGGDAASLIEKLPRAARAVRQHVTDSRVRGPTALQTIQEAATELQGAATEATAASPGPGKPASRGRPAPPSEPSPWLSDYVLAQSAQAFMVVAQAPIVVLLVYFLLASGEHFRRKLVQLVGPLRSRQRDAVRILEEIDAQIQRYLLATLGSNILIAIATWIAFEALGMEQAGVWGVAAGVLHLIPYLGPVLFAVASGVAAFLQFGSTLDAFAVAGASLVVAAAVGSLFMTWLQSRFARVNAAVLFIGLLFFGWLWGIWGLLLGAPLVAIAKAICDRVEALRPMGELLGH